MFCTGYTIVEHLFRQLGGIFMTGKTHVAIGIAAALTITQGQPLENQIVMVATAALSSLFPDLDHPKSRLNQKILFFKNKFFKTLFYLGIAGLFVYAYLATDIKSLLFLGIASGLIGISIHRGFTHSLIGLLSYSFLVKFIATEYNIEYMYTGFVMGFTLHLIADFFTSQGIKLFYPLKKNISAPIVIKTNNSAEKLIFIVLSFYSIILILRHLQI